jgi:hypothetical protein
MYIIVNTVHKSDNKDDDDDDDNNNNKFTIQIVLKMLCSVHHFHIPFAFKIHSEWQTLICMLNKFVYT